MNCTNCGSAIPQGQGFCAACGHRLTGVTPPPPPPSPSVPYGVSPPLPTGSLLRRPRLITLLAVLHFVAATVYLIAGLIFVILTLKGGNAEISRSTSIFVALILLSGGALQFACGRGLWTLKPYGRTLELISSFIGLLGFPIGTIISGLILVYMFKPEIKLLFSGRSVQQLSPAEAAALAQFAKGSSTGGTVAAVVAVIIVGLFVMGIAASIAIPNLLNVIQRGKQKRSMADIRSIAAACEAYAMDHNSYPDADSVDALARILEPKYIKKLPRQDSWESAFVYRAQNMGGAVEGPDTYFVVSFGNDKELDRNNFDVVESVATTSFNNDLIFSNGEFVQYPEGSQQ